MADQPAQDDRSQTPTTTTTTTTKILALTQLHATLATILLVTTTTTITTSTINAHQHAPVQGQAQTHGHQALNLLAYLHFWCATLGFSWWYAAQALPGRVLVQAGWKPVFHVLCVGLIGAFVGDMVLVGLRGFGIAGYGTVVVDGAGDGGDDAAATATAAARGRDDEVGGGGHGDGRERWVGEKVMGIVSMAVVGGPVGLLVFVLWPGVGWYLRRVGRAFRWTLPYAFSVFWVTTKWLLWGLRLAAAWIFWATRLAFRLFWGAG